jgi:hypothetical protein
MVEVGSGNAKVLTLARAKESRAIDLKVQTTADEVRRKNYQAYNNSRLIKDKLPGQERCIILLLLLSFCWINIDFSKKVGKSLT